MTSLKNTTESFLSALDIYPFKPGASVVRSFSGFQDRVELMRGLAELNERFIKRQQKLAWTPEYRSLVMTDVMADRYKNLNDHAIVSISHCGQAVFHLSTEYLAGNGEEIKPREIIPENRLLTNMTLSFAMRAVKFDERFASILLALTPRTLDLIKHLNIEGIRELSQKDNFIPMHPLPSLTPDAGAGFRFQTSILTTQLLSQKREQ